MLLGLYIVCSVMWELEQADITASKLKEYSTNAVFRELSQIDRLGPTLDNRIINLALIIKRN